MAAEPTAEPDTDDTDVVFASYAKQIDSILHPEIVREKELIRSFSEVPKLFGQDELIVVGSSVDGSKVNVPGDGGDIDILLIRKHVKLDQDFIDYSEQYPSFLHVRVRGTHKLYFKDIKLVDGKYLPVASLKSFKGKYGKVNVYVNKKRRPKYADILNYINRSAVGLEHITIDASEFVVEYPERERRIAKAAMEQFLDHIGTYNDLVKCHDQTELEEEDETAMPSERKSIRDTLNQLTISFAKDIDSEDEEQMTSIEDFPTYNTTEAEANIMDHVIDILEDVGREAENNQDQVPPESHNQPSNPETRKENTREDIKLTKLLSADYVPVFPMEGWPKIAYEWLSRKRHWPTQETIDLVKQTGCHVLAKRPLLPEMKGDPKNEDHSPEHDAIDPFFRVSFSQCELVLSKSLSEPQLQCWRVLKAFQKAYLHTEPRVLASYHWKNVVFKVFEDTEPEFWTETSILKGVQKALCLMIECLERRFVPLYFIPECNLIQGCRGDLIEKVRDRVVQIRDNPLKHLKDFISNPPPPDQCKVDPEKRERSNETEQSLVQRLINGMSQMLTVPADLKLKALIFQVLITLTDMSQAQIFQLLHSSIPSEDSPDLKPNLDVLLDNIVERVKSIDGCNENHPLYIEVKGLTNLLKKIISNDSSDDESLKQVKYRLDIVVETVRRFRSNQQKSGAKKNTTDSGESPDTTLLYARSPDTRTGVPEASNGHDNPNNQKKKYKMDKELD